eukprot:TRINITY_DN33705_c0_g1_i1.p1 TRINITY_DN33705_c0_g1~~TRINITY_DN33705_c0_g1_i1.p1  ORF type:complete len:805 (-),score=147.47 TRINITY_DN33705_c0_g1_i1:59-2425(-)
MPTRLYLRYKNDTHKIEVEESLGVEVFRMQVYSATEVPPEEQLIVGMGTGPLHDDADLHSLGLTDGTFVMLNRKEKAPPAAPAPAASQQKGTAASIERMQQSLTSGCLTAQRYEDPGLQAKALALVPLDVIKDRASASADPLPGRDEELKQLMNWFKHSFFTWMNNPPCNACGEKGTKNAGTAPPTAQERKGDAGGVEVYTCPSCGATTRFPRYNNPETLLETRTGRCGEWANAFTLFCRALKFEARWVHDWTDHVWTEVWSEARSLWLHCDSCENAIDKPLIYEAGWQKKLSYVISFSWEEVVDVTRRYTRTWPEVESRRNECSESWLEMAIAQINQAREGMLPATRVQQLHQRAEQEKAHLFSGQERQLTAEEQVGRESGSVAWRQQRGEIGDAQGTCAVPAASTKSSQAWQVTADAAFWQLQYSAVRDAYFVESGDNASTSCSGKLPTNVPAPTCRGWQSGVAAHANVRRKEEEDWNMVYLARTDDKAKSSLQWTVEWSYGSALHDACHRKLRSATALLCHSLHNPEAQVTWSMSSNGSNWHQIAVAPGAQQPLQLNITDAGAQQLHLRAELQGGNWQATQLFRQSREQLYCCELDLRLSFEFAVPKAPPPLTLEQALRSLLSNPVEQQSSAFALIRTLAGNIAKEPTEPKYRSVRLTNDKIARGLVRPRGALQAMMACGWELDADKLVLPTTADHQQMQRLVSLLPAAAVAPAAATASFDAATVSSASGGYPAASASSPLTAQQQLQARVKVLFQQLVKEKGMAPNEAAAQALQMAQNEAKQSH